LRPGQSDVKLGPVSSTLKMPATCQPTAMHHVQAKRRQPERGTCGLPGIRIHSHVIQLIHRNVGAESSCKKMPADISLRQTVHSIHLTSWLQNLGFPPTAEITTGPSPALSLPSLFFPILPSTSYSKVLFLADILG